VEITYVHSIEWKQIERSKAYSVSTNQAKFSKIFEFEAKVKPYIGYLRGFAAQ
jgi:hypothetical protein